MLTTQDKKLIMVKEEHNQLISYFKKNHITLRDEKNARLLSRMEEAELIDEADFPWEVVRLNTKVIIRDKTARVNYTYTVVLPEQADHRKCKVSVLSPIGSALFGSRRGDDVYWQTSNGKRYFTIMAVSQYAR